MKEAVDLWPEEGMSIKTIRETEYLIEVNWSRNLFEDYKSLSFKYAQCGHALLYEIINSGNDNEKSDLWFLPSIYLMRHSMELGLKALHCRVQKNKTDIQRIFLDCGHNLSTLFSDYISRDEAYLSEEEQHWLSSYFRSLETVDAKSDMFRFPFSDAFLSQYRDKFLDNYAVVNNMLQAFSLVNKCLKYGNVDIRGEFVNTFEPSFLILANHGFGNCYLWQPISDEGFFSKIDGYIQVTDFLFYHCNSIPLVDKSYPIIFLLRNTLELCLKRLFYARVINGVSPRVFNSKRKSHLLIKDLWANIRPVIVLYSGETPENLSLINIVENILKEVDGIDKKGDIFRYPTSYSLEYRICDTQIDMKNFYEVLLALINFLNGCDSMLEEISEYENDIYLDYMD